LKGFAKNLRVPNLINHCPVIGVPVELNAEGLPMGVQIIGKNLADFAVADCLCLRAGDAWGEKAVGVVESKTTSRLTFQFRFESMRTRFVLSPFIIWLKESFFG
jgi:hypothetical protein